MLLLAEHEDIFKVKSKWDEKIVEKILSGMEKKEKTKEQSMCPSNT